MGHAPSLSRRTPIYAIVRRGGRQYRLEANQLVDVDRFEADVGQTVELTDVLLLANNGEIHVGTPLLDGARVLAEVIEQGRDRKILVFKYKNKTRYRRRRGHRQAFTRLAIRQILEAGEEPKPEVVEEKQPKTGRAAAPEEAPSAEVAAEPKPRRVRRPKVEAVTPEAMPEVAEAEAQPKPRRVRRAKAQAAETKTVASEATAEAEAKSRRARRPKSAPATTEAGEKPARRPAARRKAAEPAAPEETTPGE